MKRGGGTCWPLIQWQSYNPFCLVTLVVIVFDVDEENIFQNDSLCFFITPFILFIRPLWFLLALTLNCSPLIIFRKKSVAGKCNLIFFF